jgi:hypothetical protein
MSNLRYFDLSPTALAGQTAQCPECEGSIGRDKCWLCDGYGRVVVCSCGCGALLPDNGRDETGRPIGGNHGS